jgi:hypothetical protein
MSRHSNDPPEKTSTPKAERLMKALRVIERVAAENETLPKNLDTEKEVAMHEDFRLIFRLAHTAREPSCMDSHPNWEDELQTLIHQLDA